jgi:hypothetical protein
MIQTFISTWITNQPKYLSDPPRKAMISSLMKDALEESDRFTRVFKIIHLFQYLEFHSHTITLWITRSNIEKKIKELLNSSNKYIDRSHSMDPNDDQYIETYAMACACQLLKVSCLRLQAVLSTLPSQ